MTMMIVQKGFDTVFKILIDNVRKELDLLKNWGKATKEKVKDWVKWLQNTLGDKFDKGEPQVVSSCCEELTWTNTFGKGDFIDRS